MPPLLDRTAKLASNRFQALAFDVCENMFNNMSLNGNSYGIIGQPKEMGDI